MDAMSYEFLIRRVHGHGRNASKGADADIYRKLEYAERELLVKSETGSSESREIKFRQAFAEVRMYVRTAIDDGLRKIRYRASKEEIAELNEMATLIHTHRFYDKKRLDEFIDRADDIFHKYGLEPG